MKSKYILLAMSLLMCIQFSVVAQETAVDPEKLLEILKIGDDSINAHNTALFLSDATDDVVYDYVPQSTPFIGKEAFAGFLDGIFMAFPDFHVDFMRPLMLSGNIAVIEHIATGTQKGEIVSPLGNIPPTGKSFKTYHMDIVEFEGDKVKKIITYDDAASQFMQLGILPVMALPEFKPSFTLPDPEPKNLSPLDVVNESSALWNAHDLESY